jgi:hypothetical protein
MAIKRTANSAQGAGGGATLVRTVSGTTPDKARRMSTLARDVSFFVYCREPVTLPQGSFQAGDAHFFSGKPSPVDAPQCDLFEQSFLLVGYANVNNGYSFTDLGCYTLDGEDWSMFDVAIVYAGTITGAVDDAQLNLSSQVTAALQSASTLQSQGMVVLLSIVGFHQDAGWSCFPTQAAADAFASQVSNVITQYGIDGVDIDDEYSNGPTNDVSLIMATSGILANAPVTITKALWNDIQYFKARWHGTKLADNLVAGWEMSYGATDCYGILNPYVEQGMDPLFLCGGADATSTAPSAAAQLAQCIGNNQYGGMMVYNATSISGGSAAYLTPITKVLDGKTTVVKSGCLSGSSG